MEGRFGCRRYRGWSCHGRKTGRTLKQSFLTRWLCVGRAPTCRRLVDPASSSSGWEALSPDRKSLHQRRIVTSITDDELKLTNPRTPAGVTLELVLKRPK